MADRQRFWAVTVSVRPKAPLSGTTGFHKAAIGLRHIALGRRVDDCSGCGSLGGIVVGDDVPLDNL